MFYLAVCLSVSRSARLLKSYEWILVKFLQGCGMAEEPGRLVWCDPNGSRFVNV